MAGETVMLGDEQPKPAGTWDWYGKLDPLHNSQTIIRRFSIQVFRWQAGTLPGQTTQGRTVKQFTGLVGQPEVTYQQARAFIRDAEERSLNPVPDRLQAARTLILAWREQAQQEPGGSSARQALLTCAEELERVLE